MPAQPMPNECPPIRTVETVIFVFVPQTPVPRPRFDARRMYGGEEEGVPPLLGVLLARGS